jgi:predicted acylesterase/phospholipase RssA
MANVRPERLDPPVEEPDESEAGLSSAPEPGRLRRVLRLLNPGPHPGARAVEQMQQHHVWLIWLFQGVVLVASMGACLFVGVSPWFWGSAFVVYTGSCVWLGFSLRRNLVTPNPLARGSVLLWLMKAGVWLTSIALWLTSWAVALRTRFQEPFSEWFAPAVICAVLVVLGVLTYVGSAYSIRHGTTPWFQFSAGLTFLPFLGAWFCASVVVGYVQPRFIPGFSAEALQAEQVEQLALRQQWHGSPAWTKPNGEPITVAVALSGGGYRAATFHAGVLKALDDQHVPIRYVATVSGGSIIGAYYALGHKPERFRDRISKSKPGLPDSILTVWYVALDLWYPGWNSADTYSRHFRKTFFDGKTLGDTGTTPQLLVNVTDIEKRAAESREVLYKDRDPSHKGLNKTLIAEVVAASGAFPGPFQPKEIAWPDVSKPGELRIRKFVDGGVFENLGYTGMANFLVVEASKRTAAESRPLPDILILSDASAVADGVRLPAKVDLFKLLARSEDISYQVQLDLLRFVLGSGVTPTGLNFHSVWLKAQYEEARDLLDDAWFPSKQDKGKVPGATVAMEVSRYRTLQELEPEMVSKAFWLGETLAARTWPQIEKCRAQLASLARCAERAAAP